MRLRPRLLTAGVFVLGLALVAAVVSLPSSRDLRESANLSLFDPGNIISDGVFYDSSTMGVDAIQTFLNAKGSGCTGSTCLKNYRQDTVTRAGDGYCNGYQGVGQEGAAAIIRKVAVSCGINPQVLLVTLQKEQGLITSTGPSSTILRKAMGFGCPDTPEGCDAQYYGFHNQLYMAARQFKLYQARPTRYGYRAGLTNTIAYYPNNPACGSARVYIQNQATAGLYNYTPYVPNQAALNAGYGRGDGCSSYGNRNFFNYFTDWFGTTQTSGGAAVLAKYESLRAAGVDIGAPTADVRCDLPGGGCVRSYAYGDIYWSRYTGAHVVRGDILARYKVLGGPGLLGYPTGDDTAAPWNTGFFVDFEHGSIYWSSATGAWEVRGEMLAKWRSLGAQAGYLGYPVGGNTATADGGFSSDFQYGSLYWSSATGARVVRGEILRAYRAAGGPGVLGYPTVDEGPTADGWGVVTSFQVGDIFWTPRTGAHVVRGEIRAAYRRAGASGGYLGFPVTSEAGAAGGGAFVDFEYGSLYWSSATGARVVRGEILRAYRAAGGPGSLGYPTVDEGPTADGWGVVTSFQVGDIFWTPRTGAHVVRGEILAAYRRAGASGGYLGFPVTSEAGAAGGGAFVDFEYGSLYWSSATGVKVVRGEILKAYRAAGGPGSLGYPTVDEGPTADGWGVVTSFQSGDIFWTPRTGAHVVRGEIRAAYRRAGASGGYLGFPVTSEAGAAGGGAFVDFEYGSLYWSSATGVKVVRGEILKAYRAAGGPGVLGYPTVDEGPTADGRGVVTSFQSGDIFWTPRTGAHVVRGEIRAAYRRAGASGGYLGFPVTSEAGAAGGGAFVDFEYGSLYWSSATGVKVVRGEILKAYRAAGGPGSLGYPTVDEGPTADGRGVVTSFQVGDIFWTPRTGAHVVRGEILAAYRRAGASGGYLGFPITSDQVTPDGQGRTTSFAGGTIYWSAATGAHVLRTELNTAYLATGGTTGTLGYPVSDTSVVAGQQRADFQHGTLSAP